MLPASQHDQQYRPDHNHFQQQTKNKKQTKHGLGGGASNVSIEHSTITDLQHWSATDRTLPAPTLSFTRLPCLFPSVLVTSYPILSYHIFAFFAPSDRQKR